MAEYNMRYTGFDLDDAINKFKNDYINKTKVSCVATGVVTNVASGGNINVTGIVDDITKLTFNLKGFVCFICPTTATNYTTSGSKPAICAFYKMADGSDGTGIAAYNAAYSLRINPVTTTNYVTISGNSFKYTSPSGSMYGLLAAERWRWIAWG